MNQLRSLSRFPELSGKNRTPTAFFGHFRTAVAFSGGFWTITAFSGGIGTLRDSILAKNGPRMPDVSECRPETYTRVQIPPENAGHVRIPPAAMLIQAPTAELASRQARTAR